MTYTLLIVESPAKCGKIEKYLGSGYKCIASFGHICELDGLTSIDIDNDFTPTFTTMESKNQQISKLRSAIAKADDVILAADDDREGEAIAWHLCQEFNLPIATTKRIIFHEVTEKALKKAVEQPGRINMNIVRAQQARQILDVLVGFNVSPILWQKISQNTKTGLSAGRCQTPALRLIYENQKAIESSPGRKVYNTTGYFTQKNLPFVLNHNYDNEENIVDFLEQSVNHDHVYACSKPRNTTKSQPTPFTTSGLQQAASNELRISPKETMKSCQKLYEGGYITYMRTDSTTYSKEFLEAADLFIQETYGVTYVREDLNSLSESKKQTKTTNTKTKTKTKTKKKSKKAIDCDGEVSAQEAHEAIRPTDIVLLEPDDVESRDLKVYKLIRRNTLESCMAPATYLGLTASLTAPQEHAYRYSTEQVVFPGWKVVAGYEEQSADYTYLLTLKMGSVLNYKSVTAKVTLKDLKTHYTEAKLVQLLEQNGIGRPSTFSSLVEKIQERKYVTKKNVEGKKIKCVDFELVDNEITEDETDKVFGNEKGKLVIEPVGVMVVEFLIQHFDVIFQYDYTKMMENTLDTIAKGEKIWHELCRECLDEIETLSEGLVEERVTIPIDESHTYMIARYGPVIKCVKGGKTTFKKVRDDIDIEKLRAGDYSVSDIIDSTNRMRDDLGKHKGTSVILKTGQYGPYVEWGNLKRSVKVDKEFNEIVLEDVIPFLKETNNPSIIRKIDDNTSIRTSKHGDYVFHKKPTWKKPQFLKLNDFIKEHGKDSYKTCELKVLKKWLSNTYSV